MKRWRLCAGCSTSSTIAINVTLTLSITEQLIAAEPKVSRAFTGSEVCGRRKEGQVEIRLRPESFEKTRASLSAIEFVHDFAHLGAAQGGYNEDHEFYGYRMPI